MDNNRISKITEDFFYKYKKQNYKKGELLIRADDDPSGIFYLIEGNVKEYAISKKGDELVVNIFKPYAFFPMSWAINSTPNSYFFEATTDVTLWKAPKGDVLNFLKNNPEILFDLLSRVYKGTDGMMTRMTYLMAGNAYGRLITEIIIQAKRFGKSLNNTVVIKITEKDIASQSGMTRETVSREMKKLKERSFITFNKNVLSIKDIHLLEDELLDGV